MVITLTIQESLFGADKTLDFLDLGLLTWDFCPFGGCEVEDFCTLALSSFRALRNLGACSWGEAKSSTNPKASR